MAEINAERVRDTSVTTGTGDLSLAGAADSTYQAVSAVASDGDTGWFFIRMGADWERTYCRYNAGAGTLTRLYVKESTNSNAAVDFGAGTKDIINDVPAKLAAVIGGRNKAVNGAHRIDQEHAGASQTYTAAAAIAYNVDQFYGFCTGANVTGQQVASTLTGFSKSYKYTGAASVTGITHGTRLEGAECDEFINKNVTISLYTKNSLLTTVTWTAYYANSLDTFSSKTQIATGTFTVSSSENRYIATFAGGANIGNGLCVEFSVGSQTSGTWELTGVQIELGSIATPFERVKIAHELVACQRFFEIIRYGTGALEFAGVFQSAGTYYAEWTYKVTKRASASFSLVSGAWLGVTPTINQSADTAFFSSSTVAFIASGTNTNICASASARL